MKILGIDYGERRIGLAVSEGEIATPLGVLKSPAFANVSAGRQKSNFKIKELCQKEKISKIVIGISEGKMAEKTRKFAKEIQEAIELPVEFFDETLTSKEAIRTMVEAGTSRKKRRRFHDAVSAALILQGYLENYEETHNA